MEKIFDSQKPDLVCSWDVSTTRSAYAIHSIEGSLVGFGAWVGNGSIGKRLNSFTDYARGIAYKYPCLFIGMEDLRLRNIGIADRIGWFRGVIVCVYEEVFGQTVNMVSPASRAKAVGITKRPPKGRLKHAIIERVNELYGLDLKLKNNDEADAIAIGRVILNEYISGNE